MQKSQSSGYIRALVDELSKLIENNDKDNFLTVYHLKRSSLDSPRVFYLFK